MDPIDELDTIDAEEEDTVDDVGEAADFTEKEVEALNDEDGGDEEESEEDKEDSDNPGIGGFEFIVDVSTDPCAFFVIAVVIVHDNFKFDELFVETEDVCDKSVGSCTCCSGSLEDENDGKSLPTRHAPPGRHLTCPTCPRLWFCVIRLD